MENTNSGKNVPEKKFSTVVVSATIWKNNGVSRAGQPTEFRTITLQRRYNKEGEWKSTNSLRINDLPKASLVLQKAYEYIVLRGEEASCDASYIDEEEIVM